MNDVSRVLTAIEQGDPHAAEQFLPLIYDKVRQLAVQRLAQRRPGRALQATALVHEAYLRLEATSEGEGVEAAPTWSRGCTARPSGTSMAYAPGIVDIIHPHPGT